MKRAWFPTLILIFVSTITATIWAQDTPSLTNQDLHFRPFRTVLSEHFKEWDSNHDGILSEDEIDSAVINPKCEGEAAAAIAAIKLVVRGGKYNLPPLTLDYLLKCPLKNEKQTDEQSLVENVSTDGKKSDDSPSIDPIYRLDMNRLHKTNRELFPDNLPSLQSCQQGRLGDCYLVSVIGGIVHRNPKRVKAMLKENDDGSTIVSFSQGRIIKVSRLTDAEICLSSNAGTNGLWLPVLENAYGKLKGKSLNLDVDDEPETDWIAHGGKPGFVINVIDGFTAIAFNLKSPKSQSRQFAANIRQHLITALQKRRLIELVTPATPIPTPRIFHKHAWAVIGYNSETDIVRVWNPHGNNFTPKEPDGIENGYTTKAGQFDIPLKDVLKLYSRIIFETTTPVSR